MTVYFQHIEGSKKGLVEPFNLDRIRIGRLSDSDLKFNPRKDRAVSGNHAEIYRQGEVFVIEDLKSRNGTFVNKSRIIQATPIADGDLIEFSTRGPKVVFFTKDPEIRTNGADREKLAHQEYRPKSFAMMVGDALAEAQSSASGRLGGLAVFIREVFKEASAHSSRRFRLIFISLLILLLEVTGGLIYVKYQKRQELNRKVQELIQLRSTEGGN